MLFLPVELVEELHREMIDRYGGSPGLRDRGLLESAVARAENTAYYNPDATAGEVAASLAWGLIKNHAFVDGNKRVGFAALVVFLDKNGWRLNCPETKQTEAVLHVAAGEWSEAEWTMWVTRSINPI